MTLLVDRLTGERLAIVAGLGLIVVVAWAYLFYMGWGMEHMEVGAQMVIMPRMTGWRAVDVLLVFLMWAVMMVGMMLPSAMPMILVFTSLSRRAAGGATTSAAGTWAFVGGYIAVWAAFSLLATLLQWTLLEYRLVSPMMASTSPVFGGLLLVAAGVYQLTPFKDACLDACRSPLQFLSARWRTGRASPFILGLTHGLYCTGCCWLLMVLLFVLGVMNIWWVVALAILVLLEKLLPQGRALARVSGLVLMVWGGLLVARGTAVF